MLNDDIDVNIFDADESNTELKMDPILTPTKHALMPQHFTSEEEQAVMALVVKLSPIRSINSPSLRTTPLKSAEAYSFMENYLSPLPCRPVPMKSKSSMPSMQWPLEDSILDANFSLVDDKSFPLYKSPVATRPLSHIVDSPGRRGTPGCTKSLDFSDTKALDFGTPFSNFSTSPPSPFPAFTLPNKQPTSVTPAKSPVKSFEVKSFEVKSFEVKSFEVKSFEEAAPEPYRSPGSFRLKIDPQSPVNMAKTAEINNVLRTPTPHQVKAPVKFSRKSSTPKRRRHRRSGNSKKKRMKRNRTSIGSLRTQSRKRSLNVTSPKSRHRSACNCKKSKCLKLYCECFAALVMCGDCKCSNCENSEQFADVRNEAIRATKERNPNAFAPKINSKNGRHLKGCHCKKSGCKKKYCECFQANIYCGGNCKCQQCENVDAKSKREGAEDLVFLSKEFQFNCSEDRAKKSRVVTA